MSLYGFIYHVLQLCAVIVPPVCILVLPQECDNFQGQVPGKSPIAPTQVDHTGAKYNKWGSPRKDRDKAALPITDGSGRYSGRYTAGSLRRLSRLMTCTCMRLKASLAYNGLRSNTRKTYLYTDHSGCQQLPMILYKRMYHHHVELFVVGIL